MLIMLSANFGTEDLDSIPMQIHMRCVVGVLYIMLLQRDDISTNVLCCLCAALFLSNYDKLDMTVFLLFR